jgi:hypothetical protein
LVRSSGLQRRLALALFAVGLVLLVLACLSFGLF